MTSTPFHELEQFVAIPRVSGLVLSPDGSRLVTSVATLDAKATKFVTALWEVDPTGEKPARRLTRSAKGEASAAFTQDGDLLFTSARPDPDGKADDDEPVPALWLMPRDGAEARVVADRAAGLGGVQVARDADVVLVGSDVLPSATDAETDEKLRKARKEKKVAAILHDGYPVRFWDHDLGPESPHWFVADIGTDVVAPLAGAKDPRLTLTDVTPGARSALVEQAAAISPDGRTVVTGWNQPLARGSQRGRLVAVDVASGEHRVLVDDPAADLWSPAISPDGQWVAYVRETRVDAARRPPGHAAAGRAGRWGAADARRELGPLAAAPGLAARQHGPARVGRRRRPRTGVPGRPGVGRGHAADQRRRHVHGRVGEPRRVGGVRAADVVRGAVAPGADRPGDRCDDCSAQPGRDAGAAGHAHGGGDDRGGRSTCPRRGWRCPRATAEAPLLLWIHGGPLGSWNAWSWRWNPWILVARGYAVLLPDPALSTGYGQDFVQAGWGAWGAAPYTDLLAITDAVEERDDIDETRTAAMGGSFGGYMANWVAGHTDRFQAIVTHASLWALDQFGPTTDAAYYWEREMTPEMALENSPHRFVEKIVTPMLVVHGDKDYRVPIGEGLRLWYELLSRSGLPADDEGRTPHRFLYFPDENHWVLSPQHAIVWYQVVEAFLAEHVLARTGENAPVYPEILG